MTKHPAFIRRWITLCILLVAAMVLIGGATRLTESGLSIVKWKLVSGIVPPTNEQSWQQEFSDYKTSPQYKQVNRDFSLSDFKHIYWLEYAHRLLGRAIGLVLTVPLLYLLARRKLAPPLAKRMAVAVIWVALQGAVGWVMVASGLVDEPRVAPIKLALHLSLAFALFAHLLWTRWQLLGAPRPAIPHQFAVAARVVLGLVALQIIFGALVAGLDAGLSYNTYPLMDGKLVPDSLYLMNPWWKNHVESVLTVQFQHRMGAIAVVAAILGFVTYGWKKSDRKLLQALAATVLLQFGLGVATLLSSVQLHIALAHQFTALLLFALSLRLIYISPLKKPRRGRK